MARSFLKDTVGLFWPPLAPVADDEDLSSNAGWWAATCVLSVIPAAAILHHSVCYCERCMFQPFSTGYEMTWAVVWGWLKQDPSLPWAMIAAFLVHRVGRRLRQVKILVAPVFLSFLPVSVWVWDLFFLGRPICQRFHDGRFELWEGFPIRGWHFYVLGICLYIAFTVYLFLRYYASRAREPRA